MGKKIIVAITILLTAGLFTGWYLFTRESKYLGTSAFTAIPDNSAIVIRIHHLRNYTSSSLKNPFWKECSALPGLSGLYHKLSLADSLIRTSEKPNNPLPEKELTIAVQNENNAYQWLIILELASLSDKRVVARLVPDYFTHKGVFPEKTKSGEAELNSYSWQEKGKSQHFYTSLFHGLLLGSTDQKFLEQAIYKLNHPGKSGNIVFERANKRNTGDSDARIYLNHQLLPRFAQPLCSKTFSDKLTGSLPLATWSELDLTQKPDEMILNGFSFLADSLNTHLGIFLRQQPDSFRLARVFPAHSTFFLSYVITSNSRFFEDYEQLLTKNHTLDSYRKLLSQTDSLYGVDLRKIVSDHLDGAAAVLFTQPDPTMPEENKYLILSVNSGGQVEEALTPLAIQIPGRRKRDKPKNYSLFRIDSETEFKIYKTEVDDFGKQVFGEVFAGVKTNYFTIYDNCLVMAASSESLERFLQANVLHETLENDPLYRNFTHGLSDRLNLFLWTSPGYALPFLKEIIDTKNNTEITKQRATLLKIESMAWQIGNENGMIYNMARLKYNPEVHINSPSVIWKSHPAVALLTPPHIVTGGSVKENAHILVQDKDLNLLGINSEGRVLWKTKLSAPINSEIFEPDCLKNGKPQYFFSTSDALYLIGSDGKYLTGYPVKLHSPATNGVSVFDYDQNKDYRFFIAGKDHKVCLYDKKGAIVTGWTPPKTEHDVNLPVQFFRVENKDYLIFTDKNRAYILDRKGKPAVKIKGDFTFSHNPFTLQPKSGKNKARLITTDNKGVILSVGFDGSVKKLEVGQFSPDHHFSCEVGNTDKAFSYLFLDGETLTAYDMQGNRLFLRKFNHTIPFAPQLFPFPDKSIKIGVTDSAGSKIYLLNSDGSVYTGFPIDGATPFAISFHAKESSTPFNLLTAMPDGELINYSIK